MAEKYLYILHDSYRRVLAVCHAETTEEAASKLGIRLFKYEPEKDCKPISYFHGVYFNADLPIEKPLWWGKEAEKAWDWENWIEYRREFDRPLSPPCVLLTKVLPQMYVE